MGHKEPAECWSAGCKGVAIGAALEHVDFDPERPPYAPQPARFRGSPAFAAHAGAQTPAPTRGTAPIAFTGATLIDGTGEAPVANAVILVNSGRVTAVGPAARSRSRKGAERLR